MFKYILKRVLLIIPTLLGITVLCFVINITAPGGPIEKKIAELRFAGGMSGSATGSSSNDYNVPEEVLQALQKQYGFDKPLHIQYLTWLKNISTLNFGEKLYN